MTSSIAIEAKGITHIGRVRATNQDSFLVDDAEKLYIVADGMGGHAGGEIASKLCVERIKAYVKKHAEVFQPQKKPRHPDPVVNATMGEAINFASSGIYERALEDPSLKGMGTTATALKIVDDYAYAAHVGDSRLYLIRCGFIYQLSSDHSLVSEQVRAGVLTREEAELHHLRNVITRSVGYQEEEDVDTFGTRLEDGDLLLLSSDGLHGKVQDRELSTLSNQLKLKAISRFIDLANERGGEDNISVVLIKIQVSS